MSELLISGGTNEGKGDSRRRVGGFISIRDDARHDLYCQQTPKSSQIKKEPLLPPPLPPRPLTLPSRLQRGALSPLAPMLNLGRGRIRRTRIVDGNGQTCFWCLLSE